MTTASSGSCKKRLDVLNCTGGVEVVPESEDSLRCRHARLECALPYAFENLLISKILASLIFGRERKMDLEETLCGTNKASC